MDPLDIVILVLVIVVLILLIILLLKKENKPNQSYDRQIGEISAKIDLTKQEINSSIATSVANELIRVNNSLNEDQLKTNSALQDFERKINQLIDSKFSILTELLNSQISVINNRVNQSVNEGFKKTDEAYANLMKRLGALEEAQNNITSLSGQVTSLTNVLTNNQHRGKFGEFTLEKILFSIFGDAKHNVYQMQYNLKNLDEKERPDAVVFLPEPNHLICIDSKFPFINYSSLIEGETKEERVLQKKEFANAVKKHITDVKKKYIIKDLTASQAILFIPSDAIFAYINGELYELVEYARNQNVILTSPSTLQPILATINLVRISYERNKNLSFITEEIKKLGKDFLKFAEDWEKFSKNINLVTSSKENFDKRVSLLNRRFEKIDTNRLDEIETE